MIPAAPERAQSFPVSTVPATAGTDARCAPYRAYRSGRPPAFLLVPAFIAGGLMLVPFVYMIARAAGTEWAALAALILRPTTLTLLANTLSLVACVLVLTTVIALPLAFLLTRTSLARHRWLMVAAVLPLAVPGYVMAYALIGLSGYYGPLNVFFGLRLSRIEGLTGATLALGLYTFPYLFLNLRTALLSLDPALEESARSLGRDPWGAFVSVTLPHLVPALFSGWLVIALYVLGDYGAIALMRFDVFSSAIYSQYSNAFEVHYAAVLALMLTGLALLILVAEGRLTRRRGLSRTGTGAGRSTRPVPLGRWRLPAWGFVLSVQAASLGIPALVILFWLTRGPAVEGGGIDWAALSVTALQTAAIAVPVALVATAVALPVALLALRYPSRLTVALDRLTYMTYAVPVLPFALAVVFFVLAVLTPLYQTLPVLIAALALHSAALVLGPVRSRLLQLGPRCEEAARALGDGPRRAFVSVTLPLVARAVGMGAALVLIVAAKELPMTLLLSPSGWSTMAMAVFSRTTEGMLVEAAPYVALLTLVSGLSVGLGLAGSRA